MTSELMIIENVKSLLLVSVPAVQRNLDKGAGGVANWAEKKKWEKKVELLKNRTKEKDAEVEKLTRANEMLKNALDR